ncbi:MAG: hypothetical protein JSV88_33590 [Candidatus Aminicenantes bacterium]|nr:MAG: hypothetical protein JSV88_33590 [Candidatus Aminicenantes bacterium]
MGNYHTFPVLEPGLELNQQPGIRQEMKGEEQPEISMLINSVHYFIDCVYIRREKNNYRLVALHNRRVLWDKQYPTLKGCKIAFQKQFKEKAWQEGVKAEWSPFYPPDKVWLGKKYKHLVTGLLSPPCGSLFVVFF